MASVLSLNEIKARLPKKSHHTLAQPRTKPDLGGMALFCPTNTKPSSLFQLMFKRPSFHDGSRAPWAITEGRPKAMSDEWYRLAPPHERLPQGDIVFHCPLLNWHPEAVEITSAAQNGERLKQISHAFEADVVVMTQACDLEHDHVVNVVLCPHLGLTEHKALWEGFMQARGQNPSPKAWRNHCDDIRGGYVWNLCFLNSSEQADLSLELRVVDFREVFTIPRVVIEALIGERAKPRPQLLPPYKEHLSQAFARFFMRVGLPTPVAKTW